MSFWRVKYQFETYDVKETCCRTHTYIRPECLAIQILGQCLHERAKRMLLSPEYFQTWFEHLPTGSCQTREARVLTKRLLVPRIELILRLHFHVVKDPTKNLRQYKSAVHC